ncbi:MAG: sigma-54 dependent transcriptional regulator [Myxococcota bacterium]
MVGRSAALAKALALVERMADSDATVLITGESGTGKELFARALHDASHRAGGPFVAVHCGAIPEPLLASELFGHVRGAFTDAFARREGRFVAADGGTIFLDEIGEVSPSVQVKLLRVLQTRSFEPVGSSSAQRVDVRVIAATNRDLAQRRSTGHFRDDLFYRLNVLPIAVPTLRERIEDVPLLVHHFLDRARHERGARVTGMSDAAMQRLMEHDWPGNVRELENLIERLTVLVGSGEIDVEALLPGLGAPAEPPCTAPRLPATGLDFNAVVTRFENDLIEQALERTGWNKNRAAGLLRLNRTTLLEKIKKRGLRPRSPRA